VASLTRLSEIFLSTQFLFAGIACQKTIFMRHLKGKVVDKTDQAAVPFAIVSLNESTVNSQRGGGYQLIASAQCDKNGEFEIEHHSRGNSHYYLVSAGDYFPIVYEDDFKSEGRHQVITLTPKTNILVRINLTDPAIMYVYFIMEHTSQLENLDAQPGITEKIYEVPGNTMNTYRYIMYYKSGGSSPTQTGTIFCPKSDKPAAVLDLNL
jgi:hypothetical protein